MFPAVFPAEVVCRASPTAFTSLTQRSFCGSRPCELRVATGFIAQYKCPSCPFIGSRTLASRHPKHGCRKKHAWRLEDDQVDNDSSFSEDEEAERENDCSSAEDEEAERENDCSGDEQGGGG